MSAAPQVCPAPWMLQPQQQPEPEQHASEQRPRRTSSSPPPRVLGSTLLPPQQGPARHTLVLDLDKTLIDCVAIHERPRTLDHDFVYMDDQGTRARCWTRPFLRQFLATAAQHFEVVLFTAAGQRHADSVLQRIDPQRTFFAHRLYTQHTSETPLWGWVKDLSRLGRPLERTLLVDDSTLAGLLQPCNLVPVRPFAHDHPRRDVDTTLCSLLRFLLDKVVPAADVRAAIALHWHKLARRPRRRPLQPSPPHLPSSPTAAWPHRPGACDCTCHTVRPLAPPPPPPAPTVPWHQCAAVRAGCGCLFDGSRDMAALVAAYQSQQHAALWPWRADGCESDGDGDADGGAHAPPALLTPPCGCCGAVGGAVAATPSVAIMAAALPQAPLGLRRSPKRFLDLGASAGTQQQEERVRGGVVEEEERPPLPLPVWRGVAPGAISGASSASTDSTSSSSSSSAASDPRAAYAQLRPAPPPPRLAASWPPLTAISLEDGPRGAADRRPAGGNPFAAAAATAAAVSRVDAPPQWQPGGRVTGPWSPPLRVAGYAPAPLQQQQQQEEVPPARRHFGGRGAPWSTCLARGGGSAGSATLPPSSSPPAVPAVAAQQGNARVQGPFGPAVAAAAAAHGHSAATWALALRQATTRLREEAARQQQQQPPLVAAARGQLQQQPQGGEEALRRGFFCGAAAAAVDAEAAGAEPAGAAAVDAGEMLVSGCSASLQPSSRTSSDSSTTTMVDVSDL